VAAAVDPAASTPHNSTGKVFTRAELDLVAELAQWWDAYVLTDEIYEHNPTFQGSRSEPATGGKGLLAPSCGRILHLAGDLRQAAGRTNDGGPRRTLRTRSS
jgi:Aminotransferase class I and II